MVHESFRSKVKAHYQRRFGNPQRTALFKAEGAPAVEIWKWSKERSGEGVAIYATIGAALHQRGNDEIGAEYFLGLEPEVDSVVDAMAEAAVEGSGRNTPPRFGDSLTLCDPLWKGAEVNSLLFTDGSEIISPLHVMKKNIIFMQLVPLFQKELEFKSEKGELAFWTYFEAKAIPYWDPRRKSAF